MRLLGTSNSTAKSSIPACPSRMAASICALQDGYTKDTLRCCCCNTHPNDGACADEMFLRAIDLGGRCIEHHASLYGSSLPIHPDLDGCRTDNSSESADLPCNTPHPLVLIGFVILFVQMTTIAIFLFCLVLTRSPCFCDHATFVFVASTFQNQFDILKIKIAITVLIETSQEGTVR